MKRREGKIRPGEEILSRSTRAKKRNGLGSREQDNGKSTRGSAAPYQNSQIKNLGREDGDVTFEISRETSGRKANTEACEEGS